MALNTPFYRADSSNLPKVDLIMIISYMKANDKFNDEELRGVKVMMSSRDSYLENAVGYVELKRHLTMCTVKGKVVPEHRVSLKQYSVSTIIDEKHETIIDAICEDCPASAGGCKHALVFLFWLLKRSIEPSSTSVLCYWTKPALSNLKHEYVLAEDVFPCAKKMKREPRSNRILEIFLIECKNHQNSEKGLINNHFTPKQSFKSYCVFNLLLAYQTQYNNTDFENFKTFSNHVLTDAINRDIENVTKAQVDNVNWHNLRQGRITASKLHEICCCKTPDGTLVKEILGGYKLIETKAIKRGKKLEMEVIKVLEKSFKTTINKAGLYLHDTIFGASPDGVFENKKYIVEIKCPTKIATIKNYISNNVISQKCMAQVQLQMHCTEIKKCLFCVADIAFEKNNKVSILFIDYDEDSNCGIFESDFFSFLINISLSPSLDIGFPNDFLNHILFTIWNH